MVQDRYYEKVHLSTRCPPEPITSKPLKQKRVNKRKLKKSLVNARSDCLYTQESDQVEHKTNFDTAQLAKWVATYLAASLSRLEHGSSMTSEAYVPVV